jgi:hypothetical protein
VLVWCLLLLVGSELSTGSTVTSLDLLYSCKLYVPHLNYIIMIEILEDAHSNALKTEAALY